MLLRLKATALLPLLGIAALAAAEEPSLKAGDNLLVEGIPPIPMTLVQDVKRYTNFRAASLADWHPVKREQIVLTRFADIRQVHRVRMPLGARTQLTFFAENVAGASFGPRNEDFFVFSQDTSGNEVYQIYRYDLKTGESILLTDGKSRNTSPAWSTDGMRMLYMSNRRNGTDSDLYMMEPENPATDRMLTKLEGGGWGPLDWSNDDTKALLIQYNSANDSDLFMIDTATGGITRLTPQGDEVSYAGALFAKGDRGIYYVSDEGTEFQHLRYMDLTTKSSRILTERIPWDIEDMDLSPDGRFLAFVTNEAGQAKLYILETRTDK